MLLAALDLGLDAVRLEMRLDAAADALNEVAAAAFVEPLQPLGDRFVSVGLELLERQRLPSVMTLHADPLGERGRDVHRLAGDAGRFSESLR